MRGNYAAHPCGFCGGTITGTQQCLSCGTWWGHRNFHFSSVDDDLRSIGKPELYAPHTRGPINWPGPGYKTEWLGFDEDDSQAMEIYAAECEGYLLGEKFSSRGAYEVVLKEHELP